MTFHKKKYKRRIHLVFLLGMLLCIGLFAERLTPSLVFAAENEVVDASAFHWPAGPQISSEGAILIEAETGTVLYEKNATERLYPASTTKLMTALLALENSALGETVTVSHDAVYDIETNSSRIWVDVGEELSMEASLYALMLPSANDMAYAIAEHVGGSKQGFADMMNARAKELGCVNTHFMNPHGLDEAEHYTCAADLAKIMQPLIKNSSFLKISGSKNYQIPATNLCKDSRWVLNTHLMIRKSYPFDGVIAGKTGHTDLAGANLVTCAKRGNMTLISVIMKAPDDTALYDETAALLNFGFDNFTTYNVTDEQLSADSDVPPLFNSEDTVQLMNRDIITTDSGFVVLPLSASLSDTRKSISLSQLTFFSEGKNIIGRVTYTYGTHTIGSANIVYTNNGAAFTLSTSEDTIPGTESSSNPNTASDDTKNKTDDTPKKGRKPLIIGIIIGCICFLAGAYFIFVELPYRKKRAAYLAKRRNYRH